MMSSDFLMSRESVIETRDTRRHVPSKLLPFRQHSVLGGDNIIIAGPPFQDGASCDLRRTDNENERMKVSSDSLMSCHSNPRDIEDSLRDSYTVMKTKLDEMEEYNRTVTAGLPASTRAMTKLKSKLGCAPLPPSTTSERDSRLCLKRICEDPILAVIKHRVNFMAKHGTDIQEKLSFLLKGHIEIEEFTGQVEGMLLGFLKLVEEQESFTFSVDTYLNIQLCGLKECLNTKNLL